MLGRWVDSLLEHGLSKWLGNKLNHIYLLFHTVTTFLKPLSKNEYYSIMGGVYDKIRIMFSFFFVDGQTFNYTGL